MAKKRALNTTTAARSSPIPWTQKKQEKLMEMYPTKPWDAILKAFPEYSQDAIVSAARRLELKRDLNAIEALPEEAGRSLPTDANLAEYMTSGRTAGDLAKKFTISPEEAERRLEKGFVGYDLYPGPENTRKQKTYVAVPTSTNARMPKRIWTVERSNHPRYPNLPYFGVIFPDDFGHQKIRVIPIGVVLYGGPDHDAERFEKTIRQIAKNPNTFCYFNGDVISTYVAKSDAQDREEILLQRTADFEKLIKPIMHKVLWAQQGCVERSAHESKQGFDPLEHLCIKYDITYIKEPVYVDFEWQGKLWTLWEMHGYSTAQLKGSKINALRRPAQVHQLTDFIIMGHIGDAMWNKQVKVCRSERKGRLKAREEYLIILGNFLKYFGTRSAVRGHAPSSAKQIVLYMYPDGDSHVKTDTGEDL